LKKGYLGGIENLQGESIYGKRYKIKQKKIGGPEGPPDRKSPDGRATASDRPISLK
jgi:hypothetical protein